MSVLAKISNRKYTVEEYLALEEKSVEKNEYHNGEVWAMAGGTGNHSKITANTIMGIGNALREKGKDCSVYDSNLKVYSEVYHSFLYPDVLVICGEEENYQNRSDIIQNPLLIIEVLSKSTANYDRSEKFMKYRAIPSFKEYILIDQNKAIVEGFYRETADYWRIQRIEGMEESIHLYSIDCTISLKNIYWRVVLEEKEKEL